MGIEDAESPSEVDNQSRKSKKETLKIDAIELQKKLGSPIDPVKSPSKIPEKPKVPSKPKQQRKKWGGKIEFLLTCIGFAVGLGNVWRFPFLCYKNGGGAFLIPYVLMLATVGLPIFFMELAFGQFCSLGPVKCWAMNPLFTGVGMSMVLGTWLICLYYNVIISHIMIFLVASLATISKPLPWEHCDHSWNTENCMEPNYTAVNATATANSTTPAEEFYEGYVLQSTESFDDRGGINLKLVGTLFFCWIVVLISLFRGISSLGKVVYFTSLFPYVMLTVLLVLGITLPGSSSGVFYYLYPDFTRLLESRVWLDAATQIFYSLSTCQGGLITMSSYNDFHNNCMRDAVLVACVNCATSLYAGFVIFAILGFIAHSKGVPVDAVVKGGPGLVFVVYPEALTQLPWPHMWSFFFFLMMATLGFGTQFSLTETVLSTIIDSTPIRYQSPRRRKYMRVVIIGVSFLLGLPMCFGNGIYLLNLIDASVSSFPLLIIAFLEVIQVSYIYGYNRFAEDIRLMLGKRPNAYWRYSWKYISLSVTTATLLFSFIKYEEPNYSGYVYPRWGIALGWMIIIGIIGFIPIVAIYKYCKHDGFSLLKTLIKPSKKWGPAMPENCIGTRYEEGNKPLTFWLEHMRHDQKEVPVYFPTFNRIVNIDISKVASKISMLDAQSTSSSRDIADVSLLAAKYNAKLANPNNDSGSED